MTGDRDFDDMLSKCVETLKVKGADYTIGMSDRLHNFRTAAEFTGLTKEQVLGTYLYKHVAAIFAYIKGKTESEPIEGRICDVINYMLLFAKMVREQNRTGDPAGGASRMTQIMRPSKNPDRTETTLPSIPNFFADDDD